MRDPLLSLYRLALMAAFAGSALLWAEQLQPEPAVCGPQSACTVLSQSSYGRLLGVPLPVFGTAGFGFCLLLSVLGGRRARGLSYLGAALGAAGALLLILLQVEGFGRVCMGCLVVDGAACAAGTLAVPLFLRSGSEPRLSTSWALAGLAAAGAAFGFAFLKPAIEAPAELRALWRLGAINVVEVTDFRCPFCRATHASLRAARHAAATRVEHVLVPLPQSGGSRRAAQAWLFAREQGRGPVMADALFALDPADDSALRTAALRAGVDPAAMLAWIESEDARRDLDASVRLGRRLASGGVPTVWIQRRVLAGARTEDEIRDAVARVRPWEGN